MKYIILTIIFCQQLALSAQTSLTKVSFEDSEALLISSFPGNENVSWTTSTEHKAYNSVTQSVELINTNSNGFNNIYASQSATEDTLDRTSEYYSLANGTLIYSVANTQVDVPINSFKSIAEDPSGNVYVFGGYGGADRYIWKIEGGAATVYNFANTSDGSSLDDYTNITYFESGGGWYLMFIGEGSFNYAVVDISSTVINTVITSTAFEITNAFGYNNSLYYTIGNEIYYSDDYIIQPLQSSAIADEILYIVPSLQTINDFIITSGGIFYAAATDGIYSTDNTLGHDFKNISDLNLYPNPNNGDFTIFGSSEPFFAQVINSKGQIIYERNYDRLETFSLDIPAGVYYVRILSNESAEIIKFIKE